MNKAPAVDERAPSDRSPLRGQLVHVGAVSRTEALDRGWVGYVGRKVDDSHGCSVLICLCQGNRVVRGDPDVDGQDVTAGRHGFIAQEVCHRPWSKPHPFVGNAVLRIEI
jgi:hypothetical protein